MMVVSQDLFDETSHVSTLVMLSGSSQRDHQLSSLCRRSADGNERDRGEAHAGRQVS